MQMNNANEPWVDAMRMVAAEIFRTSKSEINVDVEAHSVVINWQGSMTAAPETRKAVEKAVEERLPREHKGKRVAVV